MLPCLISPCPPVLFFTVCNSVRFTESLLECWQCRGSVFLFVCVCLCVQGRREGGRGISFKACFAHCLSNLTHLFHLSLLLSSPRSLPPPSPYFCSLCHFLPAPLLSVSHLNLRHLSHAAAHICQTCIVSPLHWFPDQSGCCIFITAAAFCIFCLLAVSGIWSRPRWVYEEHLGEILVNSLSSPSLCASMVSLLWGRMPFFLCVETFNVVPHYSRSRLSASFLVS